MIKTGRREKVLLGELILSLQVTNSATHASDLNIPKTVHMILTKKIMIH